MKTVNRIWKNSKFQKYKNNWIHVKIMQKINSTIYNIITLIREVSFKLHNTIKFDACCLVMYTANSYVTKPHFSIVSDLNTWTGLTKIKKWSGKYGKVTVTAPKFSILADLALALALGWWRTSNTQILSVFGPTKDKFK